MVPSRLVLNGNLKRGDFGPPPLCIKVSLIMSNNTNYVEVKILPIMVGSPTSHEVPVPTYPENPVFSSEFVTANESQLLSLAKTETLQLPGFTFNWALVPEGYLSELLYHVMYRRDRREDRLPIYLEETLCRAPHALSDIVLAARMTRGLFVSLASTINPTIRKEARNWLLLALQLEYTATVIVNDERALGPVICKTETTYGTDTYSETDVTYHLDEDLLAESGLTAEAAVQALLDELGDNDGTD